MATEILRPNGVGSETTLPWVVPNVGADHWQNVDEVTPDEDSTFVARGSASAAWNRDLYALPASSGSGAINNITVYARVKCDGTPAQTNLVISCRTYSTTYEDVEKTTTDAYANYSKVWTTNPNTGSAWTWDEIDALEIGIKLRRGATTYGTKCTQVYVEVDYTSGVEKTSSDSGSGSEGTPLPTATLASSDSGQGQGAISSQIAAMISAELGTSVELGALLKELLAAELGQGTDSLAAKIEAPTKGGGMKLWI